MPGRWPRRFKVGLAEVPCLVETEDDSARRLVVQLTENLQRQDVPILETARAIEGALAASGLTKGELARQLGKSQSFVSKHLLVLKAQGPAREALEAGLIQSAETFRLFSGLGSEEQTRVLASAFEQNEPIGRGEVASGSAKKAKAAERKPKSEEGGRGEKVFALRLSASQLAEILRRFGAEVPAEPSELVPTLHNLLSGVRSDLLVEGADGPSDLLATTKQSRKEKSGC